MDMNILQQILNGNAQGVEPGTGPLMMPNNRKVSIDVPVGALPQGAMSPAVVNAFSAPKFPTSNAEFVELMKRSTEGMNTQREGIQKIQSQIDDINKPQQENNIGNLLMMASDLIGGTNFTSKMKTPQQKEQERKEKALALDLSLQKEKNQLTDKEIDLFKAQYQNTQWQEQLELQEKLARLKLAASGENLLPGQKAADQDFGKEYSDWNQKGGRAGYLKNKSNLEAAIQRLENDPSITGGAAKGLADSFGILPYTSPKTTEIEQQVKSAVLGAVKQLGTNPTDTDLKEIYKSVWDTRLSPKQNAAKIRAELDRLDLQAAAKDQASKYFESTRGTLLGQGAANAPQGLNDKQKRLEELRRKAQGGN